MASAKTAAQLRVNVAYSPEAGIVDEVELRVASGATLDNALHLSGFRERYPAMAATVNRFGIWGRFAALDTVLRDGDRVEVYRSLQIDPKEGRRLRQQKQRGGA